MRGKRARREKRHRKLATDARVGAVPRDADGKAAPGDIMKAVYAGSLRDMVPPTGQRLVQRLLGARLARRGTRAEYGP